MKTMNRMIMILALVIAGTAVSVYAQDKPKETPKKETKKPAKAEKKGKTKEKKKS